MSGVHFIDGQYYVEVKRDAKIGDLVSKDGIVRTVTAINEEWDSVEFDSYYDNESDYVCVWGSGIYKTLETLESEEATVDSSQASEQVIEMFTALSRKIVSLERKIGSLEAQLADTQRNLEKFAEQTESNSEDIRTLDERTQPSVREALQTTIEVLCAHITKQNGGGR